MAFTYGFYDSLNGDRKYNSTQFGELFDGLINDGVYASVGGKFFTYPGTGMQVIVSTGRAWLSKTWNYNDAPLPIAIPTAHPAFPQYHVIVIDVNKDRNIRTNRLSIISGTASGTPVMPPLINTQDRRQWPIAYILVPAAATAIDPSMISIAVGTTALPFVTGIIDTVTIDALFQNWNSQFDTWFSDIKEQFSSDAVGAILGYINNLQIDMAEAKASIATKEPIIPYGTTSQYFRGDKTWQELIITGGVVVGEYSGNNVASRTITVGFQPIAVLVVRMHPNILSGTLNIVQFAILGHLALGQLIITADGFIVEYNTTYSMNTTGEDYNYIAWR